MTRLALERYQPDAPIVDLGSTTSDLTSELILLGARDPSFSLLLYHKGDLQDHHAFRHTIDLGLFSI